MTFDPIRTTMPLTSRAIGPSDNSYTIPSRRRLIKHLRARDAEATVAEYRDYLQKALPEIRAKVR